MEESTYTSLRGRDLLTLQDYASDEIARLLRTAGEMKRGPRFRPDALRGKNLAMVFQKPSTRTRLSFEVAMLQLGGHAIYLRWDDLQLGRGETIGDTARMLSRYADGVVARVYRHSDLEELAGNADIPVINGLSDLFHPCQALADLQTILERKGRLKGVKVAYIGDGNNVCNSLLIACSKAGTDIAVASPPAYRPNEAIIELALKNARTSGATIEVVEEPSEAARDADVIYTDTFVSMGAEAEREKRLAAFLPRYQVTSKLFSHAKPDAFFMHCLPAHRGEEVAAEVLDGPRSVVVDQAENRLHVQKAVLSMIL
ncbi:MAG: ornithine carbamoyltransferase [Candidatus Bathyarchaeia archaeon]